MTPCSVVGINGCARLSAEPSSGRIVIDLRLRDSKNTVAWIVIEVGGASGKEEDNETVAGEGEATGDDEAAEAAAAAAGASEESDASACSFDSSTVSATIAAALHLTNPNAGYALTTLTFNAALLVGALMAL